MANLYEVAGCSSFEFIDAPPQLKPSLIQPTSNYGLPSLTKSYNTVCFCCFATNVPLTNAKKCSHKEFVNGFILMAPSIPLLICNICHHMLKKIKDFRLQIQNNFKNLVSRKEPEVRFLMVNNLNKNPTITITSLKPFYIKNTESQEDPLSAASDVEYYDSFVDDALEETGENNAIQTIKADPDESLNTTVSQDNKDTNETSGTQSYIELDIKQEIKPPLTLEGPLVNQNKVDNQTITIKKGLILLNPLKDNDEEIKPLKTPSFIPKTKVVPTKKIVKKVTNKQIIKKLDTLIKTANSLHPRQINLKVDANDYNINKVTNNEKEITSKIGKLLKNYEKKQYDSSRRGKLLNPNKYKLNQRANKITNYKDTLIDESYTGKIDTITLTEAEIIEERDNQRLEESFAMNKYRCESCIETFQYDFILDRHNERFHCKKDDYDVECPICKRRYNTERNMEDHSRKHFVRYVCLVCNLKSKSLPRLTLHYNKTHTDKEPIKKKYECEQCNFVSHYKGTYNYHKYNNHKLFMCNICNKKLTGSASYKYHMKLCHDDVKATKNKVSYNCDQCTASFASCALYTHHKKTVHALPGQEPMPVFCQPCNKFLSNKIAYKYHLKYSTAHAKGALKFECDYCHKIFSYKPSLQVHIQKQHLKNVNLKCNICNKSFAANRNFAQHIRRVHTNKNQPRQVCYVCGKDFVSKAVLKKHMNIHTGVRPHACDICGMTFTQSSTLYTHKKLKHKVPKKGDLVQEKSNPDS